MRDELRRLALFGSGVAELTRHRAEQIVRDLVRGGDVRREQASVLVRDLLERNRQNRKELLAFLSAEVQNQVQNLGLATTRDLQRLERRIARLESSSSKKTTARSSGRAKTTSGSTSKS